MVLFALVFRAALESLLDTGCGFWGCLFDPRPHALVDRITLLLGLCFASLVVVHVFGYQRRMMRVEQETVRRFKQLYEQASLGYLTLTLDGLILDMNDIWLTMTGYDRAALLNHPLVDLLSPAEQETFRQQFAHLKKRGWWQDIELTIKQQSGKTITIRINGELTIDEQLQTIVQCTVQDISRYKRTENTLTRIGRQSRLLLEAAGDGICGLDVSGNVIFINPAAEHLLGYAADELMWQSFHAQVCHSYLNGAPHPFETCPVTQTLQTGEQQIVDKALFWHKDGSQLPVQFSCTAIRDNERIAGAVITFKDISERLMQEAAIQESEARYRSLFYNNDSVILLVSPSTGHIIDANQAACAFYGYDLAQLVGMRMHDLTLRPAHEVLPVLAEAQATPGLRLDVRHRLAGGAIRDIEIYSGTVEIGGQALLYGIIHDITERKKAEAALRLDEARLEALLELSQMTIALPENIADFVITQGIRLTASVAGVVCLFAPDHTMTVTIHYANGTVKNLTLVPGNLTAEEQLVAQWLTALQQDHHQPFISNELLPMSALTGEAQTEIPIVERYIGIPLVEKDRVIVFAAVANKDEPYNDSDLRQLRLLVDGMWKLLQQRQTQEKTIALTLEQERRIILSDFIEAASHEFRTPLSVINTATFMIRRLAQNNKSDEQLHKIEAQSAYISHLVDRMLVLVGLDNTPDSRTTRFNVNNILESIVNDQQHDFDAADLTLTLDLDRTLPDCTGYAQFLHLALIEIVDNARQYTPGGGTVTLATSQQQAGVVITITDTGIGITPEDLPRIFQNFYRADKARTERHAGMGLTIAQRIIEFHQGSVTVESTPGAGSTFRIELPATMTDDPVPAGSLPVEQA